MTLTHLRRAVYVLMLVSGVVFVGFAPYFQVDRWLALVCYVSPLLYSYLMGTLRFRW
jgi:hypothetical protein